MRASTKLNDHLILKLLDQRRLIVIPYSGKVFLAKPFNGGIVEFGKKDRDGYVRGMVRVDGGKFNFYAHRVVWISVYGTPPPGLEVNHKNGNKLDNRISELELTTGSENSKHAWDMGLLHSQRDNTGKFTKK